MNYYSKLGIGTVQFGLDYGINNVYGQTKVSEIKKILDRARFFNIKILDTAKAYGKSEEILGRVGIQDFNVVTKIKNSNKNEILNQIDHSLVLLNTNYLYGVLVHDIKSLKDNSDIWKILSDIKNQNKVLKIGFSFNEISEIDIILKLKIVPDIIQIPFNILDNRFVEIAKYFKSKGCEIHSRSSFLQGLFFCNPNQLSEYFNEIKYFLKDLQKKNENLSADLLMYCLKQDFIDNIIVGFNNYFQFMEIIKTLENSTEIKIEIPVLEENILAPSNWKL